MQPLVSIILVNYNSFEVTIECIKSIESSKFREVEVIVVDNGSKIDLSEDFNQHKFKIPVFWIRSEENLGFAGGNNLGIKSANGDYFFLINNDTEITQNLIGQLVTKFEETPNAGLISPKIIFYGTTKIQYGGYTKLSLLMQNRAEYNKEDDSAQISGFHRTHYAHGAAMLTKRTVVKECGVMNEDYFLYYEELDWSEQIKKKGYGIYVDLDATIYHKESMSIGAESPLKLYYNARNRILFCRLNANPIRKFIFISYSLIILPVKVLSYIPSRKFTHAKSFLKAYLWHIRKK